MNIYGDIAENVNFDNGGTYSRFYNILTTPIFLDFLYVFLLGFLKNMPSKIIMLQFCLPFFEHEWTIWILSCNRISLTIAAMTVI